MTDLEHGDEIAEGRQSARKAGRLERFYFLHLIPLNALALGVWFGWWSYQTFVVISLLYTTNVSAITAGATYGAKRKAAEAKVAGYENP